jgi:hypothetical protein
MTTRGSGRSSQERGWPSVEEQLRADKVTPGSALEQLIRDNQDVGLLHPSEPSDGINLPVWLRIYWRKHHPEPEISSAYPLFLFTVYSWMLRHHDLPWRSAPQGAKEPDR